MQRVCWTVAVGVMSVAAGIGCQNPSSPPPPRVEVPRERGPVREREMTKPLPEPDDYESAAVIRPPFDDGPLVVQQTPEQRAYVAAYQRVGRPKIAVFVNRTLEGKMIPVNEDRGVIGVERVRRGTGAVDVESRDVRTGDGFYRDRDDRESVDRFSTKGPAELRESVEVYVPPGQYDEVKANEIDYEAVELVLTDWLSADGRVEIISPIMTRQRLTDQQAKDLQEGRPRVLGEIARELDTDILVQVMAKPTRQARWNDVGVRVLAEAVNIKGGQSISRAFVDVPPPLTKTRINKYTRFLARKLMDGMIGSWEGFDRAEGAAPDAREGAEPGGGFEPGTEMPEDLRDDGGGVGVDVEVRPAVPPADPGTEDNGPNDAPDDSPDDAPEPLGAPDDGAALRVTRPAEPPRILDEGEEADSRTEPTDEP